MKITTFSHSLKQGRRIFTQKTLPQILTQLGTLIVIFFYVDIVKQPMVTVGIAPSEQILAPPQQRLRTGLA